MKKELPPAPVPANAPRVLGASRTIIGATPHGGVKMTAFFYDADGKPCAESAAVTTHIIEYDKNDVPIFSL